MIGWVRDRLPTAADADEWGMVRWRPEAPGLLMHWSDVRPGEAWSRSAAYRDK